MAFSIESLFRKVQLLKFQVTQLVDENIKIPQLKAEVFRLKKENKHLKERLSKHKTPKNSNNSSIRPSQDENRPTPQGLREKIGRKPGGQQGHKGTSLQLNDNPDKTEVLVSDYC